MKVNVTRMDRDVKVECETILTDTEGEVLRLLNRMIMNQYYHITQLISSDMDINQINVAKQSLIAYKTVYNAVIDLYTKGKTEYDYSQLV